jgi:hypothetical protein
MDPVFTQIASEIGLNKKMFPFAKVMAGLSDAKAANNMPDIVIYVDSKAKYNYKNDAEDYKVMDWLNNCLKQVTSKF